VLWIGGTPGAGKSVFVQFEPELARLSDLASTRAKLRHGAKPWQHPYLFAFLSCARNRAHSLEERDHGTQRVYRLCNFTGRGHIPDHHAGSCLLPSSTNGGRTLSLKFPESLAEFLRNVAISGVGGGGVSHV